MRKKWRAYDSHAIRKVTQHIIIFFVFPHKKKQNFEKIGAILATSNHVEGKNDERNPLNLVLIAEVEETSPVIDVDEIVAKNNITDLCTLEILHDIVISKNMKMDSFTSKV
jgi:hypothetical protein